jgi:hypothetical protein
MINMDKVDSATPDLTVQRGVPMQIAPTECSIEMLGCPSLAYMQQFFIDFGTGTSADNIYNVTGIEHKIEPGSFTTSAKLIFTDAYGKYTSQIQKVKTAASIIYGLTDTAPKKSDNNASGTGGKSSKPKQPPDFFSICKFADGVTNIEAIASVSSRPSGPEVIFKIDYKNKNITQTWFYESKTFNGTPILDVAKQVRESGNTEGCLIFQIPLYTLNSAKDKLVRVKAFNPGNVSHYDKDALKSFGIVNSDGTITINLKSVIDKKIELEYIKK